jgi:hypothetical protein
VRQHDDPGIFLYTVRPGAGLCLRAVLSCGRRPRKAILPFPPCTPRRAQTSGPNPNPCHKRVTTSGPLQASASCRQPSRRQASPLTQWSSPTPPAPTLRRSCGTLMAQADTGAMSCECPSPASWSLLQLATASRTPNMRTITGCSRSARTGVLGTQHFDKSVPMYCTPSWCLRRLCIISAAQITHEPPPSFTCAAVTTPPAPGTRRWSR